MSVEVVSPGSGNFDAADAIRRIDRARMRWSAGRTTSAYAYLMAPLLPDRETVYFRNAAGRVIFHAAGFVRLAWSAERIELKELQIFYEQALTLLISSGVGRILSDHGQRQPLPAAAQQWLIDDWIPRAVRLGRVYYCAIVEGNDPVHRLSTQGVVSRAPNTMLFKRFDNRPEAEAWLLGAGL